MNACKLKTVEGQSETDQGLHKISYSAVFTALSMGTHSISFESARGSVAAWVHAFLKRRKENS